MYIYILHKICENTCFHSLSSGQFNKRLSHKLMFSDRSNAQVHL